MSQKGKHKPTKKKDGNKEELIRNVEGQSKGQISLIGGPEKENRGTQKEGDYWRESRRKRPELRISLQTERAQYVHT